MFFKIISDVIFFIVIINFPCLSKAKISLHISVASKQDEVAINYSGNDIKIVTKKEINIFNLTDGNLGEGFKIELGKIPNDIFLTEPTPYNDLFKMHKWQETRRNLKIKNTKIIDIINKDVILKTQEYINNTTLPIKIEIKMYKLVENNVALSWLKGGIPEDEVYYDINVNFKYGTLNYKDKWRNNSYTSIFLPINASEENIITINPNQTIVAKVTALKTTILLEVMYEACLSGDIIGNYASLYGKYHFWAPSIGDIMKAAKLKNSIRTLTQIEVRCYTDLKLTMYDKGTGKIIQPSRVKKPLFKIYKQKKTQYTVYKKYNSVD